MGQFSSERKKMFQVFADSLDAVREKATKKSESDSFQVSFCGVSSTDFGIFDINLEGAPSRCCSYCSVDGCCSLDGIRNAKCDWSRFFSSVEKKKKKRRKERKPRKKERLLTPSQCSVAVAAVAGASIRERCERDARPC